jgi:hypothetical protein
MSLVADRPSHLSRLSLAGESKPAASESKLCSLKAKLIVLKYIRTVYSSDNTNMHHFITSIIRSFTIDAGFSLLRKANYRI